MKKILIIILLLIIPFKVIALEDDYALYGNYTIDNYDVNIQVNENRILDVTEKFNITYKQYNRYFYRFIPLKQKIKMENETFDSQLKISDFKSKDLFAWDKMEDYMAIKLGIPYRDDQIPEKSNPYSLVTSSNQKYPDNQTYTLKYKYNLGKDNFKNFDIFYLDIIDSTLTNKIKKANITIKMPKEFDQNNLEFLNYDNIKYTKNGTTITIPNITYFIKDTPLTISLKLDDGYFVSPKIDSIIYLVFLIPIISLIISLSIWYKNGKDKKEIQTVEFYPPDNLNSLEIGFLYKGQADKKDVVSLLFCLANKGYIKMEEKKYDDITIQEERKNMEIKIENLKNQKQQEKNQHQQTILENKINYLKSKIQKIDKNKSILTITKLKDYDGNDIYEKMAFQGIFSKFLDKSIYKIDELLNRFVSISDNILDTINKRENKNKLYQSKSLKSFGIIILIFINLIISINLPIIHYNTNFNYPLLVFTIACIIIFSYELKNIKNKNFKNYSNYNIILFLASIAYFGLNIHSLKFSIIQNPIYLFSLLFSLIIIIIMFKLYSAMDKRNTYGSIMLARIQGFKNYLETVEKDKLEQLVNEDPTYFYNILPYTYVLGISNKWIQKWQILNVSIPPWYNSDTIFRFDQLSIILKDIFDDIDLL